MKRSLVLLKSLCTDASSPNRRCLPVAGTKNIVTVTSQLDSPTGLLTIFSVKFAPVPMTLAFKVSSAKSPPFSVKVEPGSVAMYSSHATLLPRAPSISTQVLGNPSVTIVVPVREDAVGVAVGGRSVHSCGSPGVTPGFPATEAARVSTAETTTSRGTIIDFARAEKKKNLQLLRCPRDIGKGGVLTGGDKV